MLGVELGLIKNLFLLVYTPSAVKKNILSLDTIIAVGPDRIGNRILKECAEVLYNPLSELFNKSLNEGIYPTAWKEALVTAIFKKVDRQIKTNYRPISLLSCISKVFEKLVFDKFYDYLIRNNILTDVNSGFKKNDSAINRLLAILENIYQSLDNHQDSIFVSLDISKAFDRVWHEGLLFKLKQLGVNGALLKWFNSYLCNRSQRVVLGGSSSASKYLHSGVPQGSILGPLLFLIYVNDMTVGLNTIVHQFADDTNLLCNYKNPVEAAELINRDLITLSHWADQWRVTFNPHKTHYMIISLKKNKHRLDPLYLNNTEILESSKIDSLGLTITNKLSWNEHTIKLINKASKRLFVLSIYISIYYQGRLWSRYI